MLQGVAQGGGSPHSTRLVEGGGLPELTHLSSHHETGTRLITVCCYTEVVWGCGYTFTRPHAPPPLISVATTRSSLALHSPLEDGQTCYMVIHTAASGTRGMCRAVLLDLHSTLAPPVGMADTTYSVGAWDHQGACLAG
jgi:hypothetical protein